MSGLSTSTLFTGWHPSVDGIAGEHILDLEFQATAQGVVNLLVQEMCEVCHVFSLEAGRGSSALQGMASSAVDNSALVSHPLNVIRCY
ncbi:MAG TPA: hypothetical protein VFJ27_10230 [Terriglobia bacterium]|nr:hypothetical protein [Terriglobia bacterium]